MQIENLGRVPYIDHAMPDAAAARPLKGEFGAEIERYARQYGLDPAMVETIMQKESGGGPNPITTMAAADLTRLKPETAAELAGRAFSVRDLQDNAELFIELFCKHLAQGTREGSIHRLAQEGTDGF